jgi:cell division protein FtsI/penicillin-binding protein 2
MTFRRRAATSFSSRSTARVQALAESLMVNKRGGIVALDVRTGGIIAMVSAPDYDPGGFAGRMSQDFVDHVMRNPMQPLFNRAIQMHQPPGSTWKSWMSIWGAAGGAHQREHPAHLRRRLLARRPVLPVHGQHGAIS